MLMKRCSLSVSSKYQPLHVANVSLRPYYQYTRLSFCMASLTCEWPAVVCSRDYQSTEAAPTITPILHVFVEGPRKWVSRRFKIDSCGCPGPVFAIKGRWVLFSIYFHRSSRDLSYSRSTQTLVRFDLPLFDAGQFEKKNRLGAAFIEIEKCGPKPDREQPPSVNLGFKRYSMVSITMRGLFMACSDSVFYIGMCSTNQGGTIIFVKFALVNGRRPEWSVPRQDMPLWNFLRVAVIRCRTLPQCNYYWLHQRTSACRHMEMKNDFQRTATFWILFYFSGLEVC